MNKLAYIRKWNKVVFMASQPRNFNSGTLHHIYNRGNQKMVIFHDDKDYARFLNLIQKFKKCYPLEILAWSLMPNHFHFLVKVCDEIYNPTLKVQQSQFLRSDKLTPKVKNIKPLRSDSGCDETCCDSTLKVQQSQFLRLDKLTPKIENIKPLRSNMSSRLEKSNVSKFMQQLQNAYAKYYALKYIYSGKLFQGVFKSKQIESDASLLQLIHYIHRQPSHHLPKIQEQNQDYFWLYSSLHDYLQHPKFNLYITNLNNSLIDIQTYPKLFAEFKIDLEEEF